MVTTEHQFLTTLTQGRPEFVGDLLRAAVGDEAVPDGTPRVVSADLTESTPTERRADQVVLYTETGSSDTTRIGPKAASTSTAPATSAEHAVGAVVLEVQRKPDPKKHYSWPDYVVLTRSRYKCPTFLVVLCPSADVARWAAKPIPIGQKGFELRATVIGPDSIPYVVQSDHAAADPELAAASTMVHARERDRGEQVITALVAGLDPTAGRGEGDVAERHRRYIDGVHALLSKGARKTMDRIMQDTQYGYVGGPFRRRYEAGRAKGKTEGKTEGMAKGEARFVLRLLENRGLDVPDDVRQAVLGCTDQETLDTWFDRAATVSSAKELFD